MIPLQADQLNLLWQLAPGDRPYVTTGNTERGLAFNPATTNLLLVSRAGGVNIVVLDAATGAELRMLNVDGVAGGTFAVNLVGISDDGVVYAGNLSTSATTPSFKLYRWANDRADTVPAVAFAGDPAGVNAATGASLNPQRWGDSLDVRGSGTNTMVVIAARASSVAAILTTTDGVTFTSKLISNVATGAGSLGVAFGAGDTLWTKSIGVPLRIVAFSLATGQGTLLKEFADPAFPNAVTGVGVNPAKKWLGGVAIATPDSFRLYDISNPADAVLTDQKNFPTDNANANNTGAVDFGTMGPTNAVFALDSNNGVVAFQIAGTPSSPPTVTTQPQSQTVLEGAPIVAFTVAASGSTPFRYQWQLDETDLPGATNSILSLTNVQPSAAGSYRAMVNNAAGSATSSNAVLTVNALVRSDVLTPLWRVAPGERPYINSDNTQRGIAYNPKSGTVLLVSRTDGNRIYVLDGGTGAAMRQLNTDPSVIFGGTYALNMIGVDNDGVVYACNLVTDSSTAPLAIYRWDKDSAEAVPTVAFLGDPSNGSGDANNRRFGDTIAVRGSGAKTQILLGTRNGNIAVILATTDGANFTPTVISTDAAAGDFGLGVAFGAGNSFWGTAAGKPLRLMDFDLTAGTGTTRLQFGEPDVPRAITAIAVDPTNNLLAGITLETPDNLRLYNLAGLPNAPALIDQEIFPTDNANINGTGSADFGGGHLYALDSNNGIVAFTVNLSALVAAKPARLSAPSFEATRTFQFTLTGTPGSRYVVETTADFIAWTPLATNTVSAGGTVPITDSSAGAESKRFYRAVVRK